MPKLSYNLNWFVVVPELADPGGGGALNFIFGVSGTKRRNSGLKNWFFGKSKV